MKFGDHRRIALMLWWHDPFSDLRFTGIMVRSVFLGFVTIVDTQEAP